MLCRLIGTISVLIIVGLAGINPAKAGDVYTFPYNQEVKTADHPALDISNTSGSITINSHPDKVIKIQAHKKVKAKDAQEAQKTAEHIVIGVTSQGETVKVETAFEDVKGENFWDFLFGRRFSRSAWVEYQIWVPQNCQILVSATSADINVNKIQAEVRISCTSGDIQLKDIEGDLEISVTSGDMLLTGIKGAADISATSGDLRVEKLEGALSYSSSSGDIKADNLKAEVQIETSSGDIRLREVAGQVRIEASSSDIIIEQVEGSLSVHTTSGDIIATSQRLSGDSYTLESSSGDIKFTLPSKQGGHLELETVSGTLRANLPITVESVSERRFSGYINQTGPEIIIRTTSGDVLLTTL